MKVIYNRNTKGKRLPKYLFGNKLDREIDVLLYDKQHPRYDRMITGTQDGDNDTQDGDNGTDGNEATVTNKDVSAGSSRGSNTEGGGDSGIGLGGATAIASSALGLGSMIAKPIIEGKRKDDGTLNPWGAATKGFLSGASTGMAIGAGFSPVGAIIGGAVGGLGAGITQGVMQNKLNKEVAYENARVTAENTRRKAEMEKADRDARLRNYNFQGTNTQYTAMGGKLVKYQKGGELTEYDKVMAAYKKAADSRVKSNTSLMEEPSKKRIVLPYKYEGNEDFFTYSPEQARYDNLKWYVNEYKPNLKSTKDSNVKLSNKEIINLANASKAIMPGHIHNKQSLSLSDIKRIQSLRSQIIPDTTKSTVVFKKADGGVIAGIKHTSNLSPIASNAVKVQGKKHSDGGEIVQNQSGEPIAEVERGEMIRQNPYDGSTEVDSAKLGTAQVTEPLLKEKGQLEQHIAPVMQLIQSLSQTMSRTPDTFKKNTIKRQLDKLQAEVMPYVQRIQEIDAQVEQVFQQQEQYKQQQGIPEIQYQEFGGLIYAEGGGWIQKAVNPAHKGYCTPMTKSTCTPRRKAFAMTMKKHHGFHKADGGKLQTTKSPKDSVEHEFGIHTPLLYRHIKNVEGFSPVRYDNNTIGYGYKIMPDEYVPERIDTTQGDSLITNAFTNRVIPNMKRTVPNYDKLTPFQKFALANVTYQVGNTDSFPKLRKAVMENDIEGIKRESLTKSEKGKHFSRNNDWKNVVDIAVANQKAYDAPRDFINAEINKDIQSSAPSDKTKVVYCRGGKLKKAQYGEPDLTNKTELRSFTGFDMDEGSLYQDRDSDIARRMLQSRKETTNLPESPFELFYNNLARKTTGRYENWLANRKNNKVDDSLTLDELASYQGKNINVDMAGLGEDMGGDESKFKFNPDTWSKVGKGIGTAATLTAPLIDNLVNKKLINKINPKPIMPRLQKPANYETYVNVNPQISNIKQSEIIGNKAIDKTVGNQAVKHGLKALNRSVSLGKLGETMAYKENKEREGRNLNEKERSDVEKANTDTRNLYDEVINKWQAGKFGDISKNMANLSNDITWAIEYLGKKGYQDKQLEIEGRKPYYGVQRHGLEAMSAADLEKYINLYKSNPSIPIANILKNTYGYTDTEIEALGKKRYGGKLNTPKVKNVYTN